MKYSKTWILSIFLMIGIYATEAQTVKTSKKQQKTESYLAIKKLIEEGHYAFDAQWLIPVGGQRLEVTGEGLVVEGHKTYGDLPFVGTSNKSVIGSADRIEFYTANTKYDIQYNDKKRKIFIKFQADYKAEAFQVFLTVQGNGDTELKVAGSSRSGMTYMGVIKKVTTGSR